MYSTTQAYQPGPQLDATRSLLIGMKEKGTLQSYVAQHQNSPEYPYLLALASSINQISDATKAAQQQQQAPQQTVADQKLSALAPAPAPAPAPQGNMQLPENMGIGQLPAPNMETIHKASGGIIAFEEGGPVPRYANTGLVDQAAVQKAYDEWMASQPSWWQQQTPTSSQRESAAKARYEQLLQQYQTQPNRSQPGSLVPAAAPTRPAMQNDPRLVGSSTFAEQTAPTLNQQKIDAAAEDKSGTTRYSPPGAPAATGIDALIESAKKHLPKGEEAPSDREGYMKERENVRKPMYEKMDKMIEEEKGKLKGDREQAFFMSMIEGGLAAAGGSSQYGLQNLAQGFAKGAAGFGEALKDIRKAAKENAKMEVEAQRMRAADKIGDMDAFQRSEESYKQRQATRDAAMTSSVFALTGDKMRADATIKAAGISASGQSSIARELGGGDLRKGLEILTSIQAGKRTPLQAYETYLQSSAGKDTSVNPLMQPEDFMKLIRRASAAENGGFLKQAPDSGVRTLPGMK